jgi:hypothetical protein
VFPIEPSVFEPPLGGLFKKIHKRELTLVSFPHIDRASRPIDRREIRNGDSSWPKPEACSKVLGQKQDKSLLKWGDLLDLRGDTRAWEGTGATCVMHQWHD